MGSETARVTRSQARKKVNSDSNGGKSAESDKEKVNRPRGAKKTASKKRPREPEPEPQPQPQPQPDLAAPDDGYNDIEIEDNDPQAEQAAVPAPKRQKTRRYKTAADDGGVAGRNIEEATSVCEAYRNLTNSRFYDGLVEMITVKADTLPTRKKEEENRVEALRVALRTDLVALCTSPDSAMYKILVTVDPTRLSDTSDPNSIHMRSASDVTDLKIESLIVRHNNNVTSKSNIEMHWELCIDAILSFCDVMWKRGDLLPPSSMGTFMADIESLTNAGRDYLDARNWTENMFDQLWSTREATWASLFGTVAEGVLRYLPFLNKGKEMLSNEAHGVWKLAKVYLDPRSFSISNVTRIMVAIQCIAYHLAFVTTPKLIAETIASSTAPDNTRLPFDLKTLDDGYYSAYRQQFAGRVGLAMDLPKTAGKYRCAFELSNVNYHAYLSTLISHEIVQSDVGSVGAVHTIQTDRWPLFETDTAALQHFFAWKRSGYKHSDMLSSYCNRLDFYHILPTGILPRVLALEPKRGSIVLALNYLVTRCLHSDVRQRISLQLGSEIMRKEYPAQAPKRRGGGAASGKKDSKQSIEYEKWARNTLGDMAIRDENMNKCLKEAIKTGTSPLIDAKSSHDLLRDLPNHLVNDLSEMISKRREAAALKVEGVIGQIDRGSAGRTRCGLELINAIHEFQNTILECYSIRGLIVDIAKTPALGGSASIKSATAKYFIVMEKFYDRLDVILDNSTDERLISGIKDGRFDGSQFTETAGRCVSIIKASLHTLNNRPIPANLPPNGNNPPLTPEDKEKKRAQKLQYLNDQASEDESSRKKKFAMTVAFTLISACLHYKYPMIAVPERGEGLSLKTYGPEIASSEPVIGSDGNIYYRFVPVGPVLTSGLGSELFTALAGTPSVLRAQLLRRFNSPFDGVPGGFRDGNYLRTVVCSFLYSTSMVTSSGMAMATFARNLAGVSVAECLLDVMGSNTIGLVIPAAALVAAGTATSYFYLRAQHARDDRMNSLRALVDAQAYVETASKWVFNLARVASVWDYWFGTMSQIVLDSVIARVPNPADVVKDISKGNYGQLLTFFRNNYQRILNGSANALQWITPLSWLSNATGASPTVLAVSGLTAIFWKQLFSAFFEKLSVLASFIVGKSVDSSGKHVQYEDPLDDELEKAAERAILAEVGNASATRASASALCHSALLWGSYYVALRMGFQTTIGTLF